MEWLFEWPYKLVMGIIGLCTALVHLCFAIAVWDDVQRIRNSGQKPRFAGGILWALAVLFGGMLVLACYWLMHHSTLNQFPKPLPEPAPEPPPRTNRRIDKMRKVISQ